MAASPHSPNSTFRRLRGQHSPAEFAALVRRAAKEIGETVSCDARYIGRVESGEIRCPNYAYERVFLHMFPGRALADLGFSPRESVRGRSAQRAPFSVPLHRSPSSSKESDVLRRAFMAGGSATVAAATLSLTLLGDTRRLPARAGESEAAAVEDAVRQIRLLDDRHGADALYRRAAEPLRTAYALLDAGATRQSTEDRLHAGAGELAVSVGWLAHDSGRFDDARSHYAEALATARVARDAALEAHAFSNMAFLARDLSLIHVPRGCCRCSRCGRPAAGRGWPTARPAGSRWRWPTGSSPGANRTPTPSGCPSSARRSWNPWRRAAGRRSANTPARPGTHAAPPTSRIRTSPATWPSTPPSWPGTWPARAPPTRRHGRAAGSWTCWPRSSPPGSARCSRTRPARWFRISALLEWAPS